MRKQPDPLWVHGLAKFLAFKPVRTALLWYVCDKEYGHLYTLDGKLYMGRWSLIAKDSWASKVLSFLTRGEYDHARIHWIGHADRDRELHDHPFNYRTFVLWGDYTEHYIPASTGVNGPAMRKWQGSHGRLHSEWVERLTACRTLTAGSTEAADLGQYHRISRVSDGGVFTLFVMGKDHGSWGFLVDGRWMRSRKFFNLRSIGHDGRAL